MGHILVTFFAQFNLCHVPSSSTAASRRAELEAKAMSASRDAATAATRCGTAQHDLTQAQAHAARLSAEHEQSSATAKHTRDRLSELFI